MKIYPKMAPKPYIETMRLKISKQWYWKLSYRNSYQNINIEPQNHIKLKESQIPYQSSTNLPLVPWYVVGL